MTVDVEDVVKAIRTGDKVEVLKYISQGIDPNDRNKLGWTLLHIACLEGRAEIAEALIDKGASVNSCTTDMCTPLHRAAAQGNKDSTAVLINKGAYINAQDKNGNTSLHEAAKYLHTEIVKLLIEKKADKAKLNNKKQKFTDVVGQQLMPVVESGDVDTLLQWLDWNLSPSTFGNLNWSILHHASARGQINIASLLLERGANVNAPDSNKSTSLHAACFHGNKRIVELLIGKGAHVNAKDQMGNTPLHSAISGAHPDIINILLESGCDTKIPNSEGQIFTHLVNEFLTDAVENKRVAHVSSLLKGQANPDTKDSAGSPVLCVATFKGDLLIVDALLESGANPNLPSEDNIKTPLHYASILGHFFILKSLLDKGASVSAKDRLNKTPLHEAAKEGFDDIVTVLVGRCSPMDAQDNEGNTPLHLAAKWGHTSIVDMLIEKGAGDSIKNNDGHKYLDLALMRAVRTEDTSQVMACLAWGGDPNTKDSKGWYLLHHAAYKGALEVCRLLIESEAEVNVIDNEERTPLLLGAYRGNQEIMEELIDSGADINMKDKQHQTPLHWAAAEGSVATVDLLLEREANRNIRNKEGKLYTDLLLKHLYFAVRHNDLEKVQCLLRAGADQTAIVKGTGTTPRDEAKRRKNFGILRQMLSLAPKKKIQEDTMAIEFISNLFEEHDSSTEDETSSSNQSDSEDEDQDQDAFWKMHNAPVIVKEKDIMEEESKSFWQYWEEKPTVISVKDWCKDDIESFWEYWEDKPKIISAKDYFKEDVPWWQGNSETSSDSDESDSCEPNNYYVISFQDAKKKWGEVISAKEFFKEDECWWRDTVKELYSSDEEETENGYKVLTIEDVKRKWGTVVPAKEFFREDECWWRDAVEEVNLVSMEDKPIDEISIPTMEEMKKWEAVISTNDDFADTNKELLHNVDETNATTSQSISGDDTNEDRSTEVELNSSEDTNTSTDYKDWETSESWDEVNDSFDSNSTMYSISDGRILIFEGSTISDGTVSDESNSYDSDSASVESSNATEKDLSNDEMDSYTSGINSLVQSTVVVDHCANVLINDHITLSTDTIDELNSEEEADEIEDTYETETADKMENTDKIEVVPEIKEIGEIEIAHSIEVTGEIKEDEIEIADSIEVTGEIKEVDEIEIANAVEVTGRIDSEDEIESRNKITGTDEIKVAHEIQEVGNMKISDIIEECGEKEKSGEIEEYGKLEKSDGLGFSGKIKETSEIRESGEIEEFSKLIKSGEIEKSDQMVTAGGGDKEDEIEDNGAETKQNILNISTIIADCPLIDKATNKLSLDTNSTFEASISLDSLVESNDMKKSSELDVVPSETNEIGNNDDDGILESSFTFHIKPLKNFLLKKPKAYNHILNSTVTKSGQNVDDNISDHVNSSSYSNHSTSSTEDFIRGNSAEDISSESNMSEKELLTSKNIIDTSQIQTPDEVEACLNSLLNTAERLCISNFHKLCTDSQNGEESHTLETSSNDQQMHGVAVPEYKNFPMTATDSPFEESGGISSEPKIMVSDNKPLIANPALTDSYGGLNSRSTPKIDTNIAFARQVADCQHKKSSRSSDSNKIGGSASNETSMTYQPKNIVSEIDDCLAKVDASLSFLKERLAKCHHIVPPNPALIVPSPGVQSFKARVKLPKEECNINETKSSDLKSVKESAIFTKLKVNIPSHHSSSGKNSILRVRFSQNLVADETEKSTNDLQDDEFLGNINHNGGSTEKVEFPVINLDNELILENQNISQITGLPNPEVAKYSNEEYFQRNIEDAVKSSTTVSHLHESKYGVLVDNLNESNTELSTLTTSNIRLTDASSNTVCKNVSSNINDHINEVTFCDTGMSSSCAVATVSEERSVVISRDAQEECSVVKSRDVQEERSVVISRDVQEDDDTSSSQNVVALSALEVASDTSQNVVVLSAFFIIEVTIYVLAVIYSAIKALISIVGIPPAKK